MLKDVKRQAFILSQEFSKVKTKTLSHSQALEIMAKLYSYPNYHALATSTKNTDDDSPTEVSWQDIWDCVDRIYPELPKTNRDNSPILILTAVCTRLFIDEKTGADVDYLRKMYLYLEQRGQLEEHEKKTPSTGGYTDGDWIKYFGTDLTPKQLIEKYNEWRKRCVPNPDFTLSGFTFFLCCSLLNQGVYASDSSPYYKKMAEDIWHQANMVEVKAHKMKFKGQEVDVKAHTKQRTDDEMLAWKIEQAKTRNFISHTHKKIFKYEALVGMAEQDAEDENIDESLSESLAYIVAYLTYKGLKDSDLIKHLCLLYRSTYNKNPVSDIEYYRHKNEEPKLNPDPSGYKIVHKHHQKD